MSTNEKQYQQNYQQIISQTPQNNIINNKNINNPTPSLPFYSQLSSNQVLQKPYNNNIEIQTSVPHQNRIYQSANNKTYEQYSNNFLNKQLEDSQYDWQKYLNEKKDKSIQISSNPSIPNSQFINTNNYDPNVVNNNTNIQKFGYQQPFYNDLNNRNQNGIHSSNTSNMYILTDLNKSGNAKLNSGSTSNQSSQNNFGLILEEKNREIIELQEKLNLISNENSLNKLLVKKLNEDNYRLQNEINNLKQSQPFTLENSNNNNKIGLETRIKELEKESQNLNIELESKNRDLESAKKKIAELVLNYTSSSNQKNQEEIIKSPIYLDLNAKFEKLQEERNNLKAYTSELQTLYGEMIEEVKDLRSKGKGQEIIKSSIYLDLNAKFEKLQEERNNLKAYTSELQTLYGEMIEEVKDLRSKGKGEAITKSTIYLDLNAKFEKLQEERNNLKAYTSELQTLYGEMIEEVKDLRSKLKEVPKIEKTLESTKQSISCEPKEKEDLFAKLKEIQTKLENAKSKNDIMKVEKESLVESINRLNKETEELRSEVKKNKSISIGNFNNNNLTNLGNNNYGNLNNNSNYSYNNINNLNNHLGNIINSTTIPQINNTTVNDLPELFKLELEEKEKAIQILQCSVEERDKIIEQFKGEHSKIISRNKSSHHELINIIEDLKFKIINLEKEINEKNNFISIHNNEFNIKKIETENLNLENKQLKDQINLIPSLRIEIDNLKMQLKKHISQSDELKGVIISKDSRIVKLEKTVSTFKSEIEEKESQLQMATEECNTTKLYEKKRDIIHSTLLDIRDLKEKISKDKNNLTITLHNNTQNILTDNSRDYVDHNETIHNPGFGNLNSILKTTEKDYIVNTNNQFSNNLTNISLQIPFRSHPVIEEATPRTEGLESYRKITEEDITFFQNTLKNFDLNLLTEFDFLLNNKNWGIISQWFNFNLRLKSNSARSNTYSNSSNLNLKLNLLFKATRDGFSHFDFKEKCLGKINTLVIAITNHDKIIGGFTPLPWENTEEHIYVKDESEKSFIFSVNRRQKLKLINTEHAICLGPDSGPIFGGGSDLEIVDNCNVNFNKYYRIGHSYEYIDTPESFFGSCRYLIKDYEVYEVVDF